MTLPRLKRIHININIYLTPSRLQLREEENEPKACIFYHLTLSHSKDYPLHSLYPCGWQQQHACHGRLPPVIAIHFLRGPQRNIYLPEFVSIRLPTTPMTCVPVWTRTASVDSGSLPTCCVLSQVLEDCRAQGKLAPALFSRPWPAGHARHKLTYVSIGFDRSV